MNVSGYSILLRISDHTCQIKNQKEILNVRGEKHPENCLCILLNTLSDFKNIDRNKKILKELTKH